MSTTAFLPNVASFFIPLTGKTLQLLPLNAIILIEIAPPEIDSPCIGIIIPSKS